MGFNVRETMTLLRFLAWAIDMSMASAAAVAPSYMEALQHSIPVSSHIML